LLGDKIKGHSLFTVAKKNSFGLILKLLFYGHHTRVPHANPKAKIDYALT